MAIEAYLKRTLKMRQRLLTKLSSNSNWSNSGLLDFWQLPISFFERDFCWWACHISGYRIINIQFLLPSFWLSSFLTICSYHGNLLLFKFSVTGAIFMLRLFIPNLKLHLNKKTSRHKIHRTSISIANFNFQKIFTQYALI